MKKHIYFLIAIILLIVVVFSFRGQDSTIDDIEPPTTNMQLSSSAFSEGESIPAKYTCDGENVSPPLEISDIPENAQSLVLIMDDPDAPAGTWVHWVVYGIDPSTTKIEENSNQLAGIGYNSWNKLEYGGPCPPSGEHRYFFKLYAIDFSEYLDRIQDKESIENARPCYRPDDFDGSL